MKSRAKNAKFPSPEVQRRRGAAKAGLAFLVLDLAATAIGGRPAWLDDPPANVARFYSDNANRLLAQSYLRALALASLPWFATRLTSALDSSVRRPDLSAVFRASAYTVAGIEFVRVAISSGLTLGIEQIDPTDAASFHAIQLLLGGVIAFPIASGQFAIGAMARESGLSTWISRSSPILGLAWLLGALRTVSTNQTLWTVGTGIFVLWAGWLLSVLLSLWKEPSLAR